MLGRKIDLLTEVSGLEVSANEWKRNVSKQLADKQQSKNARINKAILNFWDTLPIQERHKSDLCTLSMDWIGKNIKMNKTNRYINPFYIGESGYMFFIAKFKGVFVSKYHSPLTYPYFVSDVPDFIQTLESLYEWKNHQLYIKSIVAPAYRKRLQAKKIQNFMPDDNSTPNQSPNVLFSPRKKRKTQESEADVKQTFTTDIEGEPIEDLEEEFLNQL